MKGYHYRAFAHDGVNVYVKRDIGTVGCLVAACKTDDVKSCVYRFNDKEGIEIKELKIEMKTHLPVYNDTLKCSDTAYFAVSIRNNKFPLNPTNFTYKEGKVDNGHSEDNEIQTERKIRHTHIMHEINSPQKELVSFGIWGREFSRDGDIPTDISKEDVERYIEVENIIYSTDKDRSALIEDEL